MRCVFLKGIQFFFCFCFFFFFFFITSTHRPSTSRRLALARHSIGRQPASSDPFCVVLPLFVGARRPKLLRELPRGARPVAESPSYRRYNTRRGEGGVSNNQ